MNIFETTYVSPLRTEFQVPSISIKYLFPIVTLVGCFVLTSYFPIPIKEIRLASSANCN